MVKFKEGDRVKFIDTSGLTTDAYVNLHRIHIVANANPKSDMIRLYSSRITDGYYFPEPGFYSRRFVKASVEVNKNVKIL